MLINMPDPYEWSRVRNEMPRAGLLLIPAWHLSWDSFPNPALFGAYVQEELAQISLHVFLQ